MDKEYQFVAVPLNLFCRLDNNLRSMLFTLIQLQTYYAEDDGWFFRDNDDLAKQSNLSENLVRITIDVLYKEGLIDVQSVGKGKGTNTPPNRYKVNWERFKDYEKDTIENCFKDPRLAIITPKYKGSHYHPSYLDKNSDVVTTETIMLDGKVNEVVDDVVKNLVKVEDNIDNIDNKENIDNKKNIENVDNKDNSKNINHIEINYNIYKDKDTFYKSLPSEMELSDYDKEVLLFQLYQLHDMYSIEKQIDKIEDIFKNTRNEIYKEKARHIVKLKSEELGFKFNILLN